MNDEPHYWIAKFGTEEELQQGLNEYWKRGWRVAHFGLRPIPQFPSTSWTPYVVIFEPATPPATAGHVL